MKLIRSQFTSGRSLGLFLALVLAAGAYAGPGPQFGSQPNRQPEPVAASAVAPAMACPRCETRVIGGFSTTNPSGKWAPHAAAVGVEHVCASCRGAIATVRGRTTGGMTNDCAICAQARLSCCATSG